MLPQKQNILVIPGHLVTTKELNHGSVVGSVYQAQEEDGSRMTYIQKNNFTPVSMTHFSHTISRTRVLDQKLGGLPSYDDVVKKDKEETMPAARVFEQIKSWLASYREETLPTPGSVLDHKTKNYMRMYGEFTCSKNTLVGLNVLYIMASFLMIGVAIHGKSSGIITSLPIVGGITACGIFLLFISVVGLLGVVRHHIEMLLFYTVVVFLLFLIQFYMSCLLHCVSEEDKRKIVEQSWSMAYHSNPNSSLILKAEQTFKCCGLRGFGNIGYMESRYQPVLCDQVPGCIEWNYGTQHYDEYRCPPCMDKIMDMVDTGFNRAGVVGLIVSFAELIGVLVAYRFIKQHNLFDQSPSTPF